MQRFRAVVSGRVQGRILDSVKAMEKRGLIAHSDEEVWCPAIFGASAGRRVQRVYRLTPTGLEAYEKMRTTRHKVEIEKIEVKFQSDMRSAKNRTR